LESDREIHIATCMAIISNDNKLLLTKRTSNLIFPNAWVLPGGHMESGESVEESLLREVYEETGIKAKSSYLDETPFFLFESASGRTDGFKPVKRSHFILFFKIKLPESAT
jgi:mutator protein MutT